MINKIFDSNNQLTINEDGEYLINVSSNSTINVLENVNAKAIIEDINSNIVINLDKYSSLSLTIISLNKMSSNIVINIEENASLNYKLGSTFESCENIVINLNGYKASVTSQYLVLNKNANSLFNQTVNHNAKETSSVINNIGVTFDNSSIKFDTIGHIYKGMSKSSAKQLTRGVILSDNSKITSLPILKIDEYDVSANHGTAIGKMSDDELFYLMSRGLTKEDSYKLILSGLINPFIKSISDSDIKDKFEKTINELI